MAIDTVPRGRTNGKTPAAVLERDGAPPAGVAGEILQIPLDLIDVGANVRVNLASIEELAASIVEHGVRQPISVRDTAGDRYAINFGQRRYLASQLAGLTTIPAFVDNEARTAEELAIHQLIENLHRADLNPIDRAQAMRTVVDVGGLTQVALAKTLGIGASTVANDLGLLEAPDKIQEALVAGAITPAHAKAIKGLPARKQVELVNLATKYGKSAHDLESDAKYARQEIAREERDRARLEKIAASAVAQLEKSVAKGALIVVSGGVVTNAIKKAGWTNLFGGDRWTVDTVKKAGECGCATWLVDYDTYGGGGEPKARLKPACADQEHRAARQKASNAERDREHAERQTAAKAYAERRSTDVATITAGLEAELAPALRADVARAILAAVVGESYHAGQGLRERNGGNRNGWSQGDHERIILALKPETVIRELAIAIAESVAPESSWSAEPKARIRATLLSALEAQDSPA